MSKVRRGCNFYSISVGCVESDGRLVMTRRPNSCRSLTEAQRVIALLLKFKIIKAPLWKIERLNFVTGESDVVEVSPALEVLEGKRAA